MLIYTSELPDGYFLSYVSHSSNLVVCLGARLDTVVFISCKAPVDPVKLVEEYMKNVEKTGVTRTR